MSLTSVTTWAQAFYRLAGTVSADDALVEGGEATDAVAYHCLNQGLWRAQRFLIRAGMNGRWLTRSSALTSWSGTEAADGGRYNSLPSDFLMLAGDESRSALVEADGTPWGKEVNADLRYYEGDFYYLRNEKLWITRKARPKATLYIEYEQRHATITSATADNALDFPLEARPLIVSEAVNYGIKEGWCVRDVEGKQEVKIRLDEDRDEAFKLAKRSRESRKTRPATMIGTRYFR